MREGASNKVYCGGLPILDQREAFVRIDMSIKETQLVYVDIALTDGDKSGSFVRLDRQLTDKAGIRGEDELACKLPIFRWPTAVGLSLK